jgi:cytochrome c biogenesis protein CcdA
VSDEKGKNYISVGAWMGILFLIAIPCIGIILIIILAFVGENETRKNYFRAMLAWFLVLIAVLVVLTLLGHLPDIKKQIESWTQQIHQSK